MGNENNKYVVLVKAKSKDIISCQIHSDTKHIYNQAFYDCLDLTSITIPDSVTSIGRYAFRGCFSLENITIGESVESIGDFAFECTSLESITIPNSVKSIGYCAFYECQWLTSITITDSVTSIEDSAFSNCTSLESVTIGNSVTNIGSCAFSGCTSLTSITVSSDNIKYHSAGNCLIETSTKTLIAGCKNSIIPTDGTVTSIGDYAFYGCASLESITIPDSVESIGKHAFSWCTSLVYNEYDNGYYLGNENNKYLVLLKAKSKDITSCQINTNTRFIHSGAFENCTRLTSITIPDSVTSIGYSAFYDCTSLTSITFADTSTWYRTENSSYTGGTETDVTNASTNATCFKSTYRYYYWYKV